MHKSNLKTPVVFIIFNRPETTEKVFAEIAKAKPSKLLVIADGPRPNQPGEKEKCEETRAIINRVDWSCEVTTNYSDINLGCKKRISSGLNWVFDNVEEAIILEDDCLPHPHFFRFCQDLLNYYRDDKRIMHIGGNNFLCSRENLPYSYYFSVYSHIWGWATWKRAWKYYDMEMKLWPTIRKSRHLTTFFPNKNEYKNRVKIWDLVYNKEIDTWDYQWLYSILIQNGISILPKNNLISNIGFGKDATHTKIEDKLHSNLKTKGITFPLSHPEYVTRDVIADYNYRKISDAGKSNTFKIMEYIINNKLKLVFK